MLAVMYARSGFDRKLILRDSVLCEEIEAGKLFLTYAGNRHYLRSESVPGDLALKSIAVDKGYLFLEMAPPDASELHALIVREMLPVKYRAKDRRLVDTTTRKTLAYHSCSEVPTHEGLQMLQRVLWVADIGDLEDRRMEMLVRVIDRMQAEDAFLDRALVMPARLPPMTPPPPWTTTTDRGPRLQLLLQERQVLQMEQRPVLGLEQRVVQNTSTRMVMTTAMRLQQLFQFERMALSMTVEDVVEMLVKDPTLAGQKQVLNIMILGITRKMKNTRPDMSWKAIRLLVRTVIKERSESYPDQFVSN